MKMTAETSMGIYGQFISIFYRTLQTNMFNRYFNQACLIFTVFPNLYNKLRNTEKGK